MSTALARREFMKGAEQVLGPRRMSVTFQNAAERCMLAAALAREFDDPGEPALIGRAFHEVGATLGTAARFTGKEVIGEDEAVAICERVLADPEEFDPLPTWAIAEVRDLTRRFVRMPRYHFPIDAEFYEVEKLAVHELAGERLSARLDLCTVTGAVARIDDYKTGWNMPTEKEMREERRARAGLQKYAWHVAQDHPWVSDFRLRLIFPRQGVVRETTITREEVEETERDMLITIARVRSAYRAGDLKAKGGGWCKNCPAPERCPKPDARLPVRFETYEEAQEAVEAILAGEALLRDWRGSVQEFCDRTGMPFVEGGDQRLGYFGGGDTDEIDRRQVEKLGLMPLVSRPKQVKPSFTFRKARP